MKAVTKPGQKGQFDVIVDGELIARRGGNFLTRSFGAGYPDFEEVVALIGRRQDSEAVRNLI